MEGVDLRLPRLPARAQRCRHRRSAGCSPSAAARSPTLWLKLIATNLDIEIALPEDGDFGGALGAARLGLCAAEGADPAEVMTMPGIKQIIEPDASLRDAYTDQYARYRALYPAIEEARK